MDLFGEKLKEIRLEKKYSLDQMARETKISKKYLEAIENNDFSIFPSETYLVGFLRSYTEYLGLDSEKYISQYRNYKIQEQPIPINELLDIKKGMHPLVIVFIVLLVLGGVSVGSIFLYRYFSSSPGKERVGIEVAEKNPESELREELIPYTFGEKSDTETEWFSLKHKIIIPLKNEEYEILVLEIGDDVVLGLNGEKYPLALDGDVQFKLNDDELPDIRVHNYGIRGEGEDRSVNLGLYRVTASGVVTAKPERDVPAVEEATDVSASGADIIFEAAKPEAFTVQITFKGFCLFRYLIDGDYNKYDQKFFLQDGNQELPANRKVKIWMSNAGSVRTRLMGQDLSFGRTGQVAVKEIRWVRKENGRYQLEVVDSF